MNIINPIKPFPFWCCKVLPLVYDDSLSYYEVLEKVIKYLNKVIEDINTLPDYIEEINADIINRLEEQIARANEGESKVATQNRNLGDLVWIDGYLYEVKTAITAGDTYIVDENIKSISIEELIKSMTKDLKFYITPRDFGAVGDGVTDDTTALQNMFDYLYVMDGARITVNFTGNYAVTHIDIKANTNQVFYCNGFIISGIATSEEISVVTMHPNNANWYDLCVTANHKDNYKCAIQMNNYVEDGVVKISVTYSNFHNLQVQGALIGLMIGEPIGETSIGSQVSECTFTGFKNYSCMIPLYVNQLGCYINFVGGVFNANRGEWVSIHPSTKYDPNSSCCVRVDCGQIIIVGAELVKTDFSTGYGIYGKGIKISDCDWEVASSFIGATGNIDIDSINNGFNGGNKPLITVIGNPVGKCTIRNLIIWTATGFSEFTAYATAPFYEVLLDNVFIVGRPFDTRFLYNCNFEINEVYYLPNGSWGKDSDNIDNKIGANAVIFREPTKALDIPINCSDVTVGGDITNAKFTIENVSGSTGSVIKANMIDIDNAIADKTNLTKYYRFDSYSGVNRIVFDSIECFEGDVLAFSTLVKNLTQSEGCSLKVLLTYSDSTTSVVTLESILSTSDWHRYNQFYVIPDNVVSARFIIEGSACVIAVSDIKILRCN